MGRGLDGFDTRLLAGCAALKARAMARGCRVRHRVAGGRSVLTISVALAWGKHLFPFRTEQLSPTAPMVLGLRGPGRVGRRRFFIEPPPGGSSSLTDHVRSRDLRLRRRARGQRADLHTERALGLTGLLDRFRARIFSAEDVEHGKPAPDLFLHAAAVLGADPTRCAVVEDSPFGLEAARAAGMRAFAYAGGLVPTDRLRGPGTTIFDDMRELPALLGSRG